jgi:LPXTG-motif cell wall-anchored protein
VTTDPAGASIWVDEVKWGLSPAAIPGIAAGTHTLRLEKAGYQGLSVPVTVTEGKTAEYSLALEPLAGSSSTGMLPLIAGALVAVGLVGAGAYFFMKKKKAP